MFNGSQLEGSNGKPRFGGPIQGWSYSILLQGLESLLSSFYPFRGGVATLFLTTDVSGKYHHATGGPIQYITYSEQVDTLRLLHIY